MTPCPACGNENDDAARFCARCGSSLAAGCPSCGAALSPDARFCSSCGNALTEPGPPAGQELRIVTLLFADVTGSTALGERLDPEDLRDVLDTYFAAMRTEIEAEGGTVEKFIGDAVVAAFGVPAAHEDDPARALRAALRMQVALTELNPTLLKTHGVELQIRIGVNTGEVLATVDPKPGEPMVTGDAVNVAARFEQAAEPGQVVTSERTARAARTFRFRDIGPLDLKGKSAPIRAFVVEGEPGGATRGIPGLRAPMVGRDSEMALLQTAFHRAGDGRPQLMTIYGEAGVGKSRLTAEFLHWARTQTPEPVILQGRCLPYGEGITYWPLAEILKMHAAVLDTDSTETARTKIDEVTIPLLTSALTPDAARVTAALAYTVGLDVPSFARMEPRQVRAETHAAWRAFFSALAVISPVITLIDDIHWADVALLDLLEELADRIQGGVLFICPSRPDLLGRRPGWGGGHRTFSSIGLEPLSPQDAARLVALLLDVDDLPTEVRNRILIRAEGNPFFLEEIVRGLIDQGLIVHDEGRWRAAGGIADVEIPDTVQGMLAARMDLLATPEKRTLQSAAVVGRVFWPGPVIELLGDEGSDLAETLEVLQTREMVLERLGSAITGELEYIFKHVLTRDVAYATLPRRDRARAHATVAEWIERTSGGRRSEFAELLAYHYEEAYRGEREGRGDPKQTDDLRRKAFEAVRSAGEDARRRNAIGKAMALNDRALALTGGPLDRAIALEQRGSIALADYRGTTAWDAYREAVDLRLEHAPEDRASIARACARAVEIPMRWPGSMTTIPREVLTRRYLELGFANATEEEPETYIRLLIDRAFGPFAFALERPITDEELAQGRADGERAADMALAIDRLDLASAALDSVTSTGVTRGLYGADILVSERRLALATRIDDPWELGDIYAMCAWGWSMLGDFRKAEGFAREGVERTADLQAEGLLLHCMSWQAFSSFSMGEWHTLMDDIVPKVDAILGNREPPYFSVAYLGSSALVAALRQEPDAPARMARIEQLDFTNRQTVLQCVWLAPLRILAGDLDAARELLNRAAASDFRGAAPFEAQIWAWFLAESGAWDEVPAFLTKTRRYSADAGLIALPNHLDRLEGQWLLANGQLERAMDLLTVARRGFAALAARWELARTDVSLADAQRALGQDELAQRSLETAGVVFEDLRSVRDRLAVRERLSGA